MTQQSRPPGRLKPFRDPEHKLQFATSESTDTMTCPGDFSLCKYCACGQHVGHTHEGPATRAQAILLLLASPDDIRKRLTVGSGHVAIPIRYFCVHFPYPPPPNLPHMTRVATPTGRRSFIYIQHVNLSAYPTLQSLKWRQVWFQNKYVGSNIYPCGLSPYIYIYIHPMDVLYVSRYTSIVPPCEGSESVTSVMSVDPIFPRETGTRRAL